MHIKLTLFYDSQCPLCLAEMRQLHKHDLAGELAFVDLHDADIKQQIAGIDRQRAMQVLHARRADGAVIKGLDVTRAAWSIVGKHRWLAILRWPLVRPLADAAYRVFARHRYRISYWLTGRSRCQQCRLDDFDHRGDSS